MPRNIMPQFICRFGKLSQNEFWRSGMLFKYKGVDILVEQEGMHAITVRAQALEMEMMQAEMEKHYPMIAAFFFTLLKPSTETR